jgi:hypothetical protein
MPYAAKWEQQERERERENGVGREMLHTTEDRNVLPYEPASYLLLR